MPWQEEWLKLRIALKRATPHRLEYTFQLATQSFQEFQKIRESDKLNDIRFIEYLGFKDIPHDIFEYCS